MSRKPLPYRKPPRSLRDRIREGTRPALTEKPAEAARAEFYEYFAAEVANIVRRARDFRTMNDALGLIVQRWLARGLEGATLGRILDNLVCPPYEPPAKANG